MTPNDKVSNNLTSVSNNHTSKKYKPRDIAAATLHKLERSTRKALDTLDDYITGRATVDRDILQVSREILRAYVAIAQPRKSETQRTTARASKIILRNATATTKAEQGIS